MLVLGVMLPLTVSAVEGVVVPMPTLPFWSTMNAVEVADAVEDEIVKSGVVPLEAPATERRAHGVVVPMPTAPANVEVAVLDVATKLDASTSDVKWPGPDTSALAKTY